MYVCMYVCICIYIYTYIHIHIYIHIVLLMWPVDKSGCSIQSKDVVPTSGRSLQMQANYEPEADEPAAKKSKVSDRAAKFEVNHLDDSNTSVIVCEAYPALQISNLCLLFLCNKIPSSDCCRSWFTPVKLLWRWLAGLGLRVTSWTLGMGAYWSFTLPKVWAKAWDKLWEALRNFRCWDAVCRPHEKVFYMGGVLLWLWYWSSCHCG